MWLLIHTALAFGQSFGHGAVVGPTKVFFMAPGANVAAVETATGELLWRSDAAELPLAVGPRGVLAQTDRDEDGFIGLVLLDPNTGADTLLCSVPAALTSIEPALGANTEFEGRFDGEDVVLTSSYRTWYSSGPQPTEEILQAASSHVVRSYRCSPTGNVVEQEQKWTDRSGFAPTRSVDGGWTRLMDYQPQPEVAVTLTPDDGAPVLLTEAPRHGAFTVREGWYIVSGVKIEATALSGDSPGWSHPMRVPAYNGPMPQ